MFKRFAAFAAVAALVLAVSVSAAPPPSVTITSGPPAQTTSTDAVITFVTSGDPGNYALRCTLDTTVSPTCTSPQNFTNLSVGLHKFSVAWCNGSTCKRGDTHNWEVTGSPPPPVTPTADFTWAPTNPVPNEAVSFTCLTDTGTVCRWDKNLDQVPDAELPPSQPWVTTYVGVGTKTPCLQTANSAGSSAWVCHSVVVVEEPPPPSTYTYRFASFNPATDKVTGTLNRFQPSYSWWVPGQAEGTPWPQGGGIFPVSHPTYGPGLNMVLDDDMLYGNVAAGTGPRDSNIVRLAAETDIIGDARLTNPVSGSTHVWETTIMSPTVTWPRGQFEAVWESFYTFNGASNVGHHIFLNQDYHWPGRSYYFALQTSQFTWQRINCPIPFNAGEFHSLRWEIKWSGVGVANGSVKAWTSVNGGPFQQWLDLQNVATKPAGFGSVYMYPASIRTPKDMLVHQNLSLHLYNLRVTLP